MNNGIDVEYFMENNPEALKDFITNNLIDVNCRNDEETPLTLAVWYNNIDMVYYLVNAGADVNMTNYNCFTPLVAAVSENNIDMVSCLIDVGADVNLKKPYGNTALMKAISNNNLKMVKHLVKLGAEVNTQNIDMTETQEIKEYLKQHIPFQYSLIR